jgi:hypothetical protein
MKKKPGNIFSKALSYIGINSVYKYLLEEDYVLEHDSFIGEDEECEFASISDGKLTIKKGYAWNGCSPTYSIWDIKLIGTSDGIINYRTGKPLASQASLVHDALCQYEFISKKETDKIFLEMLREVKFMPARIYYYAVRFFGRKWK